MIKRVQIPDDAVQLLRSAVRLGDSASIAIDGMIINPADALRLQNRDITHDLETHNIPAEWIHEEVPVVTVDRDVLRTWIEIIDDIVRSGCGVLLGKNTLLTLSDNNKVIVVSAAGTYSTGDSVKDYILMHTNANLYLPETIIIPEPRDIMVPYYRYIQIDTDWDSKPRNRGKAVTLPLSVVNRDDDPNYICVSRMWILDLCPCLEYVEDNNLSAVNLLEE